MSYYKKQLAKQNMKIKIYGINKILCLKNNVKNVEFIKVKKSKGFYNLKYKLPNPYTVRLNTSCNKVYYTNTIKKLTFKQVIAVIDCIKITAI